MITRPTAVKQIFLDAESLLVAGEGEGEVLASKRALSFWGGVDPNSGDIIDRHHPLNGKNMAGRVLVIPNGCGSCTGSLVLLEAIHAGYAPSIILLNRPDDIIGLGAIVADEVLQTPLPVVVLDDTIFTLALQAQQAHLNTDGILTLSSDAWQHVPAILAPHAVRRATPELSADDRRRLNGDEGTAVQVAMRIILRMAQLQSAHWLTDITRVHVDGCIYTGPAGLAFAERLAEWQGQVTVPTTLNAISIDRRQWQVLGVSESLALPAIRLAEAYSQLGAESTYTCAPYLLNDVPSIGEKIAWAESNAVVYANSVLGARTNKTPDLLDICVALTGRAPLAGYYLDDGRRARVVVEPPILEMPDDAFYPLLGYVIGARVNTYVPVITGLEGRMSRDALKAFGAAFATTSSAGLFHIVGVTPEAMSIDAALAGLPAERHLRLSRDDLVAAWLELNNGQCHGVDLVALGNPHFSCEEFAALAELCDGCRKHDDVDIVVTAGRHVVEKAEYAGHLDILANFGARLVTDTCWCMLKEPIVTSSSQVIVTNSAKYAHYAPGLVGRQVHFTSLCGCVEAAINGCVSRALPTWLSKPQ